MATARQLETSGNEEDDEVVGTYSVFLTPLHNSEAHVFQFPLRGSERPYEMEEAKLLCTAGVSSQSSDTANSARGVSAVVGPNSRLTLSAQVDSFGSPSFRDATDDVAEGSNGGAAPYYYALSSQSFKPRSDYLIGYVGEGGIHFTPVDTVHHFAPVVGSDGSQFPRTRRVEGEFCSVHGAPIVPGLAASDRVQRELSRQRSIMLNTDAATEKEVNLFAPSTVESKAMCKRLIAKTVEPVSQLLLPSQKSDAAKVANSLFPAEIVLSGGIKGGEEASTSSIIRRFQNRYSVADVVRQLVQRCQVVTLSMCQRVLSASSVGDRATACGASLEDIVAALRSCAVYAHGVWVARSDDHFKGVAASLREVIITEFYKSPDATVSRAELNNFVTSAAQRRSIKEILASLATLNEEEPDATKRRWRLQYTGDRTTQIEKAHFEQHNTAELSAQRTSWEKRVQQAQNHLPAIRYGRPSPVLFLVAGDGLGGAAVPRGAGTTVASSSLPTADDPAIAPIRRYIRTLFKDHGVLNVNRAKEMVMSARATHYPTATREMLSAALQSTVQRFTASTWVLIKLDEPQVDQYRPFILQAALALESFEMRPIQALVVDKLKEKGQGHLAMKDDSGEEVIPARVMSRVLSEVCVFRSGEGLWHLKTGVNTADN